MPCTPKDATPATAAANREAVTLCDMGDRQGFADAERGGFADFQDRTRVNAEGKAILDLSQFDYLQDGAQRPDTVNPSLWRQSQVIRKVGLLKVVDGLYQVCNNDTGN
jgi:alkyl sulfatase BDS1-like metallo-beta-lactamase superfamily hydrolase